MHDPTSEQHDVVDASAIALEQACGQLLVVGFDGTTLPDDVREAFRRGERGGAILFRRNVTSRYGVVDLVAVASLNAAVLEAAPRELPPMIGVDQEGGRVKRLGPPLLQLPPMRALGDRDPRFLEEVAFVVGSELAALGFTTSFAPVLDVDSNPANPIIGDRSFARDPETVARLGVAWARGLARAGLVPCGKHYPGHGDTETDSHLALPRVRHERARIDAVELAPFREAIAAGLPSVMTAHVVFDALDPGVPATLSKKVVSDVLRGELGFRGVCISDDLFMKGVSPSGGADVREIADAGVRAIEAGCDVLLVCHAGEAVDAVHAALVARARADRAFEARVRESFARWIALRRAHPPRPVLDPEDLARRVGGAEAQAIAAELRA